ncbi:sulfur carrier protein ThiS [Marinicellulosiphila megalodicopiae]|uniref:sulfur carrier protein ThiS n=1 Tax=Marinicellulosiphila megalodicopiae TaxID=2724896 RepID=UPI003BAE9745
MNENNINISVNGEQKTVEKNKNLSEILTFLNIEKRMISIAVNSDFVPREQYKELIINEKDAIDILTPIAGG